MEPLTEGEVNLLQYMIWSHRGKSHYRADTGNLGNITRQQAQADLKLLSEIERKIEQLIPKEGG